MEGVFEKGPMWEKERKVAKTNGVNEVTRMVVLMKEEAYLQCVVWYNFSSGSSLVLHILKPYDFGFEPPKNIYILKCKKPCGPIGKPDLVLCTHYTQSSRLHIV